MKFALYVARPISAYKNIGDYIQNIAALQFLPQVDELYNREERDAGGEKIKMIMNAWYMWRSECFPPSQRVKPLAISMHLSPQAREAMLSAGGLRWFKANEPIGCRDTETMRFLASKGIRAYFSGCLTLTLGKKYFNGGERRGLIFVDPYVASRRELGALVWICALLYAGLHFRTWLCVAKKFKHSSCQTKTKKSLLRCLSYSAVFIKTYGQLFSLRKLRDAEYVTHILRVDGFARGAAGDEALLSLAESLIKKYAGASLVVTSRIHCALPCLAVGTPALFTRGKAIEENSPAATAERFGGLLELLHTVRVDKARIAEKPAFPIKNKDDYKPIAEKLQKACEDFVAEEELQND